MSGDKTAEEPLSLASIFENINTKFQNATHVVEGILGVDIPSTKQEVETALQENLNNLKESAAKIQAKVGFKLAFKITPAHDVSDYENIYYASFYHGKDTCLMCNQKNALWILFVNHLRSFHNISSLQRSSCYI